MTNKEKARFQALLEGRVQGVGFRYFVMQNASSLGITGWVRNRYDDTVEVVAEGEREDVEKLLAFLRRGPRGAMVTHVKVEWQEATGEFSRFSVKQTY